MVGQRDGRQVSRADHAGLADADLGKIRRLEFVLFIVSLPGPPFEETVGILLVICVCVLCHTLQQAGC